MRPVSLIIKVTTNYYQLIKCSKLKCVPLYFLPYQISTVLSSNVACFGY